MSEAFFRQQQAQEQQRIKNGQVVQQQQPLQFKSMREVAYAAKNTPWLFYGVSQQEYEARQTQQQQTKTIHPSLAQTLMEYTTRPLISKMSLDPTQRGTTAKPFARLGGLIAPFENVAYNIERIAGIETPNLAPLPSLEHPEYTEGYFTGEALMLLATVFTVGKAVEGVSKASQFLGQKTGISQTIRTSDLVNVQPDIQEQAMVNIESGSYAKGRNILDDVSDWLARRSGTYRNMIESKTSGGYVDVTDTGWTAPRTMSEKALGLPELDSPYQLGMKGIEAESGALSFGTVKHTALLDPDVTNPFETGITREVFAQRILPPIPSVAYDQMSFLPKVLGITAMGMFQVASARNSPTNPSVKQASRLSLKSLTIQGSSMIEDLVSQQTQKTEQILKQQQNLTVQSPQRLQAQMDYSFDSGFSKMMLPTARRRKSAWERRYIWEFPVKGLKEVWKKLKF